MKFVVKQLNNLKILDSAYKFLWIFINAQGISKARYFKRYQIFLRMFLFLNFVSLLENLKSCTIIIIQLAWLSCVAFLMCSKKL